MTPEAVPAPGADLGPGSDPSFQALYQELRAMAGRAMARESKGRTLQPTALVHEAYIKLVGQEKSNWKSDSQFFSVGALVMRRILVDHARKRNADKRGGGQDRVPLEDGLLSTEREADVIAVDDAITELAELDERQAKIVEMRFFGGMTEPQMADMLEVSERTVRREWRLCRAWLRKRLGGESLRQ